MKEIKLTQGKFALVDDDMFEELNQFKWYADKNKYTFYAKRNICINGKRTTSFMHRVILELMDKNTHCDHKDLNGLNNQKSNLRKCSNAENNRNQNPRTGCTSRFKGVCWNKKDRRWRVQIMVDGKINNLGNFKDELKAAITYDKAAKVHYGEFANVNF